MKSRKKELKKRPQVKVNKKELRGIMKENLKHINLTQIKNNILSFLLIFCLFPQSSFAVVDVDYNKEEAFTILERTGDACVAEYAKKALGPLRNEFIRDVTKKTVLSTIRGNEFDEAVYKSLKRKIENETLDYVVKNTYLKDIKNEFYILYYLWYVSKRPYIFAKDFLEKAFGKKSSIVNFLYSPQMSIVFQTTLASVNFPLIVAGKFARMSFKNYENTILKSYEVLLSHDYYKMFNEHNEAIQKLLSSLKKTYRKNKNIDIEKLSIQTLYEIIEKMKEKGVFCSGRSVYHLKINPYTGHEFYKLFKSEGVYLSFTSDVWKFSQYDRKAFPPSKELKRKGVHKVLKTKHLYNYDQILEEIGSYLLENPHIID